MENDIKKAKELIASCKDIAETYTSTAPFFNSLANTLESLTNRCVQYEKDSIIEEATLKTYEHELKEQKKITAMIKTWFGEDVYRFISLAADVTLKNHKAQK